ncbi:response regulator transcription factor [Paenibacillus thalictri]|nr:response regulator [Paenibacillus thalictri]
MRIVLVDDEDTIRKGLMYLLEQLDMDISVVAEARNGQDGLQKIELLQPDFAFIDIRMPVMNGLQLVQRLYESKRAPQTKSVIVTAHSEFEYAQQALRYGVADFLLKPLDENALQELFDRQVTSASAEADLTPTMGMELIDGMIARQEVSHPVMIEMLRYIGMNYMKNLKLSDLSETFRVTPTYVSLLFKKTLGVNFVHLLNGVRTELAKKMLEQGGYKIYEIAYMVGYSNITYFDRVFKARTGMTPNEYVNQVLRNRL